MVQKCSLPLTGEKCVDIVVTELGIFKIKDNAFQIIELSDQSVINLLDKDIFRT